MSVDTIGTRITKEVILTNQLDLPSIEPFELLKLVRSKVGIIEGFTPEIVEIEMAKAREAISRVYTESFYVSNPEAEESLRKGLQA